MFSYSLSFPLLSFHRLYITLASTLAGLKHKRTIINYIGRSWREEKLSYFPPINLLPSTDNRVIYIIESGVAHLNVFGSLRRLTTLRRMVLTFCVGFHRSQGSSPDWGSSTGGWRIEMHKSPFSYTFGCQTLERNLKVGGLYG